MGKIGTDERIAQLAGITIAGRGGHIKVLEEARIWCKAYHDVFSHVAQVDVGIAQQLHFEFKIFAIIGKHYHVDSKFSTCRLTAYAEPLHVDSILICVFNEILNAVIAIFCITGTARKKRSGLASRAGTKP